MAKSKNTIVKQFENLLLDCGDILQEVESTLKGCGYSPKQITKFISSINIKSLITNLQRDMKLASTMSEDEVHDTFTQTYMEDRESSLEHVKAFVNEQLAQQSQIQPNC